MSTMIEEDIAHLDFTATDNDPAHVTHIVYVPPEITATATAYVLAARIEGFAIEALCGYTWVPFRDPSAYPVCEECLELYRASCDDEGMPDA